MCSVYNTSLVLYLLHERTIMYVVSIELNSSNIRKTSSSLQSYTEFHADIFPETPAAESALTASQWFSGSDTQVSLFLNQI